MMLSKNMRAVFEQLPAEECKKLLLDMFDYFYEGIDNRPADLGWLCIKSEFDEDKQAYEKIIERNRAIAKNRTKKKLQKINDRPVLQKAPVLLEDDEEAPFRDYKYKPSRYPIQ